MHLCTLRNIILNYIKQTPHSLWYLILSDRVYLQAWGIFDYYSASARRYLILPGIRDLLLLSYLIDSVLIGVHQYTLLRTRQPMVQEGSKYLAHPFHRVATLVRSDVNQNISRCTSIAQV